MEETEAQPVSNKKIKTVWSRLKYWFQSVFSRTVGDSILRVQPFHISNCYDYSNPILTMELSELFLLCTWEDAFLLVSGPSFIPLFCVFALSQQWKDLLRAALIPEQIHHPRFHLTRPTLTYKLPANRPPPISLSSHPACIPLHILHIFCSCLPSSQICGVFLSLPSCSTGIPLTSHLSSFIQHFIPFSFLMFLFNKKNHPVCLPLTSPGPQI